MLLGAPWVAVALFGDAPDVGTSVAVAAAGIGIAVLAPAVVLRLLGFRIRITRA